jgi:TPR repeat protein
MALLSTPRMQPRASLDRLHFLDGDVTGMTDISVDLGSGIAAFETKNFGRAMQLLGPLAEQGNPEAEFRVAVMWQNGLGVAPSQGNAYRYMRHAAEQGHALAQHGLGFMYLEGECAEKDEAQAAEWFRKAVDQGLAGSMTTLAMMYQNGQGVEKDEAEAKRLFKLAGFDDAAMG